MVQENAIIGHIGDNSSYTVPPVTHADRPTDQNQNWSEQMSYPDLIRSVQHITNKSVPLYKFYQSCLRHSIEKDPLTRALFLVYPPLYTEELENFYQDILVHQLFTKISDFKRKYTIHSTEHKETFKKHLNQIASTLNQVNLTDILQDLNTKMEAHTFDTILLCFEKNRCERNTKTALTVSPQIEMILERIQSTILTKDSLALDPRNHVILQKAAIWIHSLSEKVQKIAWGTLINALYELHHLSPKNKETIASSYFYSLPLDQQEEILFLYVLDRLMSLFQPEFSAQIHPAMPMILPYILLKENRPFASDALYHMYCDIAQYKLDKNNQLISTNSSMTLSEEDFITLMIKRKCFINQSHAKLILAIITGGYQSLVERASINKEPWNCTAWLLLNENLWDRLEEHFIQSDYWSLPPRNTTALKKSLIKRLRSSNRLPINCSQEALLSILPELFAGLNVNEKSTFSRNILDAQYVEALCSIMEFYKLYMINCKNKFGGTALELAVLNNKTALLLNLINNGAQIDENADDENSDDEYSCLPNYSVMYASEYRNLDCLKILCKYSRSVDQMDGHNRTALIRVCFRGFADCVDLLVKAGAQINQQDQFKQNPIMILARYGHLEAMKVLLTKKPDLNKTDHKGMTALMLAVRCNHVECARLLLQHGADKNIRNTYDETALIIATNNGYDDCVQMLTEKHEDFNITDSKGYTALEYAYSEDHSRCIEILSQATEDTSNPNSKASDEQLSDEESNDAAHFRNTVDRAYNTNYPSLVFSNTNRLEEQEDFSLKRMLNSKV